MTPSLRTGLTGLALLLLALPAGSAFAAGASSGAEDAPVRRVDPEILPRAPRERCVTCGDLDLFRRRTERWTARDPLVTVFNLLFRLDEYLYAPGTTPRSRGLTSALRLSWIAHNTPAWVPSREQQDVESLSIYILELPDFEIVAAARQQGRGGFWAELLAGDRIRGQANALVTGRGSNPAGTFWLVTHALQLRAAGARLRVAGAPVLFALVSLEDDLTQNARAFDRISVLPGVGLGARWLAGPLTLTLSSGLNAGVWVSLTTGDTRPGFSVSLLSLDLQLLTPAELAPNA